MKLEKWSVVVGDPDPYMPPEMQEKRICGLVFGHPQYQDGHEIVLGSVDTVEGSIVKTLSGSVYELGEPDPEYVAYCKTAGCHVPTKEQPIKFR
jgi:hypothetical protein